MADRERQPTSLLIADSDALVRHGLAEYLRHCGYRVIEAASFEEAVHVLGAQKQPVGGGPVEFVLSDVQLAGGGNGFALRAWLREHYPDMPIVLAGSVQSAAAVAGELCDKGPELKRPYAVELVVEQIRRRLAERARA